MADLASGTLSSCHRDRICNTASLCGLPSQATFYRMMAKILLPVLCACVLVSGAPPKVPQESGPPCPPLEIPDDAVVSVVVEGRVSLVRCGSVQHVLLCVSGRWSSQFPCSSQHTWNNLEAEHGEGWRAWNNVDAASHVEGGTFSELEAVSGVGRGREKRSPNTGKYEALRRRVKVQRKIRQGLLATTIDPSTPPLVSVHDGSDAFLLCRVQNLGGHSVSWIRQKDNRVIAIDSTVLVGDSRFLPSSEDQTETGFLRISGVRSYDAGDYECRVSTRPPLRKVVTLQVVPQGQPLHARDRDQPEERQEVNFLLKNISALWEEVNDLRQEVNHHLHQDHDESDHDNILRETGVLHHEHHVHHLRRPHESHNDHHDGELLNHLNTYHGHAQHQGHQESSDQNQQGESAEENDGEDDDHDEGADDDDHSDHGDESHHTLGHDEDAHDHHGLHQDYDEYHEHGHEHGKEHGHGHERGHGHGHGGRGHGRGSHHHQHSEDGEEQSLGSPEAPERKPNDPWRRATCTLEPNAEMPSSDVRGSITISQR
ncbi:putative Immunoglobulin I-set domain-containing protein 2, partial [Homarus americanus]